MKNKAIYRLVLAALMAALTCMATMVIRIPSPMGGYVNLGDGLVLLSAWLLGPLYGAAAAGIGSMMADVLGGYFYYVPGTLIIKAGIAVAAYFTARAIQGGKPGRNVAAWIVGGIVGEAVMVLGYFCYASLFLGKGLAAAASIPGNLVQGAAGIIISVILVGLLNRTGVIEKIGLTAWNGKNK